MPPKGGTKKAKKTGREIFDSQFDIDVEVDNGEHYREICSDREIREDRVHFEALRDFGNFQKKMKKWTCNFYFLVHSIFWSNIAYAFTKQGLGIGDPIVLEDKFGFDMTRACLINYKNIGAFLVIVTK